MIWPSSFISKYSAAASRFSAAALSRAMVGSKYIRKYGLILPT